MLRRITRRGWVVLLSLTAVVGWGGMHFSAGERAPSGPPPVLVSTVNATLADVPLEIDQSGNVVAYETVAVRARIDSQIVAVKFKDGQRVEAGDLLFTLDDRTIKARIVEMQANVKRDEAQLENFRLQYERIKTLNEKGFQSAAALDAARANYDAQLALVGASKASLKNTQVQLDYTTITAPISGRTGTINVTEGNTVKANDTTPLVTINRVQPIWVNLSLPQEYFDAVRQGLEQGGVAVAVQARRTGSDVVSEGKVEYIDNAIDPSSGTFAVRAVFPNTDEALWPGMFVNATLKLGVESQVLTLPEAAVQKGQDGYFVFAIEDGKARKQPVEVRRIARGVAVVKEGISEGQVVASDGLMSLRDGAPVKMRSESAAPASSASAPTAQ